MACTSLPNQFRPPLIESSSSSASTRLSELFCSMFCIVVSLSDRADHSAVDGETMPKNSSRCCDGNPHEAAGRRTDHTQCGRGHGARTRFFARPPFAKATPGGLQAATSAIGWKTGGVTPFNDSTVMSNNGRVADDRQENGQRRPLPHEQQNRAGDNDHEVAGQIHPVEQGPGGVGDLRAEPGRGDLPG